MSRIVCVGSINMDIAAYATRLPRAGETIMGSSLLTSPGGKGLNQAVAARRLGADVTFVGNVGRDANGDALLAFLQGEGIGTDGISRLDGGATGAAIILVDAKSENSIVVIPGANMTWTGPVLDRLNLRASDVVMAQFEIPDDIIIAAFSAAQAAGARTVLNPAPARVMPAAMLGLIDVLIVNEVELAAVIGAPLDAVDLEAVGRAALEAARGRMAVVCTLGKRGAIVAANGMLERIEAVEVEAIDTAGAGDCFIGALAAAIARGEPIGSAAAYASRAAGISVTRRGTAISMPFASEL